MTNPRIEKLETTLEDWKDLPIKETPVERESLQNLEKRVIGWIFEAEAGVRKVVAKATELETLPEYKPAKNVNGDLAYAEDTKAVYVWLVAEGEKWTPIAGSFWRNPVVKAAELAAIKNPETGQVAFVTETLLLYYYKEGAWHILEWGTNAIKNAAVTEAKIASEAVTEGKIKDEAVTTNKIKDKAVSEGKLADVLKRLLLGTSAAEALKKLTSAESIAGFEPSATQSALVTVSVVLKKETMNFKVEANGKVVQEIKLDTSDTSAGNIIPLGTFLVNPGKTIKLTKTTGDIEEGQFSVQLMN